MLSGFLIHYFRQRIGGFSRDQNSIVLVQFAIRATVFDPVVKSRSPGYRDLATLPHSSSSRQITSQSLTMRLSIKILNDAVNSFLHGISTEFMGCRPLHLKGEAAGRLDCSKVLNRTIVLPIPSQSWSGVIVPHQLLPLLSFPFFFESTIYYMVLNCSLWQHYPQHVL